MNYIKIFFHCLLAFSLAAGVTSCKEEDDGEEIVGKPGKLEGEWTSLSYGCDLSISKNGRIQMLTYSDEVMIEPDHAIGIIQKASNNRLSIYTQSGIVSGTYHFDTIVDIQNSRLRGVQIMELNCPKLVEGDVSASGRYTKMSDSEPIILPVYSDILGTWSNQFSGESYVFNSDGTGYQTKTTNSFDWVFYKGVLYIHKKGASSYEKVPFSISGDNLTIKTLTLSKSEIKGEPGIMQGVWLKANESSFYIYNGYYYGVRVKSDGSVVTVRQQKGSSTLSESSAPELIITSVSLEDKTFKAVCADGEIEGTASYTYNFYFDDKYVIHKQFMMTVSFGKAFSLNSYTSYFIPSGGTYIMTENADGTAFDFKAQDSQFVKSWRRSGIEELEYLTLKADGTGYKLGVDSDEYVQYYWGVAGQNIVLIDKSTSEYVIYQYSLQGKVLTLHTPAGDLV
ncbi:MAG: hypothetical protein MJZ19_11550, partial [Paludibacteraceae bacterium]|nr:hypothetical protein [Paludibacteraceae bacterium]